VKPRGRVRQQPQRSCVGCRTVRAKRELIRVVRTPTGEVVLDEGRGKLPGRGAYVCVDRECLRRALRSKALERALKQPVPDEVVEQLSRRLDELAAAATHLQDAGDEAGPRQGNEG